MAAGAYDHAVRPELLLFHPRWATEMNAEVTSELWNPAFGHEPAAAGRREIKPRLQQIAST